MPASAPPRPLLVVLIATAFALAPSAAAAAAYDNLGALERTAVEQALAARGLQVDSAPQGKVIGQIHVFNHEVFSPADGYFQLLNYFHRTTREETIRREVLLQPGDVYDDDRREESMRNLRDEDFSSLVVIVPVKTTEPGKVDLLAVTRDVWSLRFNTDFRYEGGSLVYLVTSLSENNVLGLRKKAAFAFNMDQGSFNLGPTYVDPNVAGTRLTFTSSVRAIFSRETRQQEGWSASGNVDYPLWSLARKWGAGIGVAALDHVARVFLGNRLATVDLTSLPGDPDAHGLPLRYRARSSSLTSYVRRSFGQQVIQRLTLTHTLSTSERTLTDDFPTQNPTVRDAFIREWLPPSKRLSAVTLGYSLFTPRYRVYRDFDTFDLREDAQLGPSLGASVTRTLGFLGSEWDYVSLGASAAAVFDLGDGLQSFSVGWGGFVQNGRLTDKSSSVAAKLATPVLFHAVRVVASAGLSVLVGDSFNGRYTIGGGSFRGYAIGEFDGDARWLGHLEVRSRPLSVAALRLGGLVFYDVGHAAPTVQQLGARNDVGAGFRLLIPQLNYYVLRADWAFALQDGNCAITTCTRRGWPGRFSAGFQQAF